MKPKSKRSQQLSQPLEIHPRQLALPLLVPRVAADDVHAPLAPHDLAILANPLDARSNFHDRDPVRLK
jgi:hypothetical protein